MFRYENNLNISFITSLDVNPSTFSTAVNPMTDYSVNGSIFNQPRTSIYKDPRLNEIRQQLDNLKQEMGHDTPSPSQNVSINQPQTTVYKDPKLNEIRQQLDDLKKQMGQDTSSQTQNVSFNQPTSDPDLSVLRQQISNLRLQMNEPSSLSLNTPPSLEIPQVSESSKVVTPKSMPKVSGSKQEYAQLADVYNPELSERLAKISVSFTYGKTQSTGWCAKQVRLALEASGIVEKNSTKVKSAYMLTDVYSNNSAFKRVNVSREQLKNLPAGCIVVWNKGAGYGSAFEKHGHVFITQGNGKASSDYIQDIKDYGTDFAVFVPVK